MFHLGYNLHWCSSPVIQYKTQCRPNVDNTHIITTLYGRCTNLIYEKIKNKYMQAEIVS
jgi:hypothetical protein